MALDSNINLQAAIAGWLNRDDLTSSIPDFITLCEAQMNKDLRTRQMIKRAQATISHEYEDLPGDYLEMLGIQIPTAGSLPPDAVEYISPSAFNARTDLFTPGTPSMFTIIGEQLRFGPPPSSLVCEVSYYAPIPPLALNASNWLLVAAPEIYLYGSLIQSAPYLRDDQRVGVWQTFYATGVSNLNDSSNAAAHAAGPLRARANIGGLGRVTR